MAAKKASDILSKAVSGVGAFDPEKSTVEMPPKVAQTVDKATSVPSTLHFEYEKSGLHRVVYADGMYGGVAPRGNHLNISFFSERWPIPKQLDFTPTSAGQNWAKVEGEPKAKKAREGIFREVEVTVVMDLQVAQSFYRWLGEKISLLTTSQGEVERIESNAKEEEHEQ